MPRRPTWMGFILACFMALEAELQVTLHVRPFGGKDAVHDGVANAAVAPRRVMPDHAVLLRAQGLDGTLRAEVEVVGAQADDLAADLFEAMLQQHQLARRVDVAALPALRVPGVADLDAVGRGDDVVIARTANDRVAL